MSLLAWFPLDGTTENRGALGSLIQPTIKTTPTYQLGKTGYAMKDGQLLLSAEDTAKLLHRTTSFAFWIKPLEDDVGGQIFGNWKFTAGKDNRKFSMWLYPNSRSFHWSFQRDEDNETTVSVGVYPDVVPVNEWTHIALIADSARNVVSVYFNGVLRETMDAELSSGTMSFDVETPLLHSYPTRLISDFRIYDHALTAKEVHELYKACIVHYNFEDLEGVKEYSELNLSDASGWLHFGHAKKIKESSPAVVGSFGGSIPGTADASYPISIEQFNPSFLTNCTFCFWFKATDFQNGLLYASDENSNYYLGAMNENKTWNSEAHFQQAYIDGVAREGLIKDNNRHFYCLTGVNIQNWTKIYINRHSDNQWNYRGDMCDFKIFATSLTAEEVMQEYKSRIHLLTNGRLTARVFQENAPVVRGPICPEGISAAGNAVFIAEVLDDPISFTGKVLKGTCTVAGSGPHVPWCPKSELEDGHKYVMTFMAKSDNKTYFKYTYEASFGADKAIKTDLSPEWQEYSILITCNKSTQYESFTWYVGWEVGENIYLCNFQVKDVTNAKLTATGKVGINELTELSNITKNYNDGRISTAEAIEL